MTDSPVDDLKARSQAKAVRLLFILVAITAALSLLYAIQYYLGGPIRLSVVSSFNDLAISPSGALIAAGTQDGEVRLWEVSRLNPQVPADFDVTTEAPWTERTLGRQRAAVIEVAFAPDEQTLISVSGDGEIQVWDVASRQMVTTLDTGHEPLVDADTSADGVRVAVLGEDGIASVWDLTTGQNLRSLGPGENDSLAVALDASGGLLAVGDGANVQIWNVETGEVVQRLEGHWEDPAIQEVWLGHEKEVTALAFSPDGQLLASGSADTTIIFWDVTNAEILSTAEGHWATVTTAVFDEDGAFVLSGGKDNKVRNLRVQGGKSTASYEGHLTEVTSTGYGPVPDTITSSSDDGTLRVWETRSQKVIHIEWSRYGLQQNWGSVLAMWMLVSGVLGLVALWGLRNLKGWSHLLSLIMYLVGPIVVLGLPLLEVLSYPLTLGLKLLIAWPLILLGIWYAALLVVLTREDVAVLYEAPQGASLSDAIISSQRTVKTRFGIYGLAVWIGLLVILYSILRRFNLDIAFMGHFFTFIMGGAGLTVLVSAASIALAVVLALLGALGRLSRNPIANGISSFYISLIRGTPLLVQIFIWYLGLPQLGIILDPIPAGILALSVNYGAYMTEIFRAGIQAIGKGQHEAAEALGMSRSQTFRRIVLPQAFRIVIPPIGNEFIAMMKDSSLVYLMGVWELTFRAQKIGRQNFRTMETFIIAAAFYWILTVIFQFLQGKLEEYMARGERR